MAMTMASATASARAAESIRLCWNGCGYQHRYKLVPFSLHCREHNRNIEHGTWIVRVDVDVDGGVAVGVVVWVAAVGRGAWGVGHGGWGGPCNWGWRFAFAAKAALLRCITAFAHIMQRTKRMEE